MIIKNNLYRQSKKNHELKSVFFFILNVLKFKFYKVKKNLYIYKYEIKSYIVQYNKGNEEKKMFLRLKF